MRDVADARQAFCQRDRAVVAKRGDRLPGRRVQLHESMTAVEEDAQLPSVSPRCCSSQLPSTAREQLAKLVGVSIEPPFFLASLGIERGEAVVRGRHVERAIDHQRRALELAGRRPVFLERCLPMLPLPGDLQPGQLGRIDVGQWRVARAPGIVRVVRPLDLRRLGTQDRQCPYNDETE